MSELLAERLVSHTSAYVSIRQHTSAYVSIRQIRQKTKKLNFFFFKKNRLNPLHTEALHGLALVRRSYLDDNPSAVRLLRRAVQARYRVAARRFSLVRGARGLVRELLRRAVQARCRVAARRFSVVRGARGLVREQPELNL